MVDCLVSSTFNSDPNNFRLGLVIILNNPFVDYRLSRLKPGQMERQRIKSRSGKG